MCIYNRDLCIFHAAPLHTSNDSLNPRSPRPFFVTQSYMEGLEILYFLSQMGIFGIDLHVCVGLHIHIPDISFKHIYQPDDSTIATSNMDICLCK